MKNKQSNKSRHLLNIALVALAAVTVATASLMTGCGDDSGATADTAATKVITETQIVTNIVPVTDENGSVVNEGSDSSSAESEANNSSNSSANGNSSQGSDAASSNSTNGKTASSGANSSAGSNKSSSSAGSSSNKTSSSAESSKNNNANSSEVLSIDGNKFHVGDTVTCKIKITTPDVLENYQAELNYDTNYLKVNKAVLVSPAKSGGIINYKSEGSVKFNGSNIGDGYDYTSGGTIVEVTFEVVASGSTTPTMSWTTANQFTSGTSGTKYVNDGKLSNGMTCTLIYS
jgi:hypothetical protein